MKIFYFSSTHWDREWYQSFQGFRKRLVEVARGICDTMEKDTSFGTFHFDGQSIVLEDIAEVDPATDKRLRKLIKDRRILIGPWYVMPDEFLVSGEAMIKNLRVGHALSAEYDTEAWKFGYVCDTFGHIAQMPQILKGFGIDQALLGRGTNEDTTQAFFRWKSLDGSEVSVVKIPDYYGYGDFAMQVFGFDDTDINEKEFSEKAKKYIDEKLVKQNFPVLILMDGIDHIPIHPRTPIFLTWLKKLYPQHEFLHTNLEEAGKALEPVWDTLQVKVGELIEPAKNTAPYLHLITNTLSSYYPLKRWNDICESQLERIVGPLMVQRNRSGAQDMNGFVELAWRYLLKTHAHDSIDGCAIAQVHTDMEYRFSQCSQLISELIDDELKRTEERLDEKGRRKKLIAEDELDPSAEYVQNIFNALPFPREEVIDLKIQLPEDYKTRYAEPFGYQSLPSFILLDEQGHELPYKLVSHARSKIKRVFNQAGRELEEVTVNTKVYLKPMSWTTIRVIPAQESVRYFTSLKIGTHKAQTETLGFTIENDGTLTLEDRRSGKTFSGLNQFVVDGEIGDGWFHANPVGDIQTYSSAGTLSSIELLRDTPDEIRYRITHILKVPESLEWQGTIREKYAGIGRSDHVSTIKIQSEIGLRSGSPGLDYKLSVDNNALDFRLRVLFPTTVIDDYFAHQTFAVINRPSGRIWGDTTRCWKESEPIEKNFSGFLGKRNKNGQGLAIIAPAGLHEAAAWDDEDGTVAITLLRAFRRTMLTSGEGKGQLQGIHNYDMMLRPICKDTSYAQLHRDSLFYGTDLLQQTISATKLEIPEQKPAIILDGDDIVYSTFSSEDPTGRTATLRICNYSDKGAKGTVQFRDPLQSIDAVDFLGSSSDGHAAKLLNPNKAILSLDAWKIATYTVRFKD